MLDAHFLSIVIIVASIMVTPIYVMAHMFSAGLLPGRDFGSAVHFWFGAL